MRTRRAHLILGLLVISAASCSSGSSSAPKPTSTTSRAPVTTTTTKPVAPEGWTTVTPAPTGLGQYAIWTGHEYIGGPSGCCDDLGGTSVVAYQPTTDAWRTLAPFPLLPRSNEVTGWTGREMIVVGGREARSAADVSQGTAVPTASGAALNPTTDTWRTIAPMPEAMATPLAAVWTGNELVVFDHSRLYAYSPGADRWRIGAAPPFARDGAVIVGAGRRILVWGGSDPETAAAPGNALVVHADGAVYDARRDRWDRIPAAPVPPRTGATGVWTGRQMIVWGGIGAGGTQGTGDRGPLGKGAAYNPTAKVWRALPASPLKARWGQQMVWTGREALIWGGFIARTSLDPLAEYPRDGAAYDPKTNAWRRMAPAPPTPPAPLTAYSAVWTGQAALFLGGETFNAQGVGPLGLSYTPGR